MSNEFSWILRGDIAKKKKEDETCYLPPAPSSCIQLFPPVAAAIERETPPAAPHPLHLHLCPSSLECEGDCTATFAVRMHL